MEQRTDEALPTTNKVIVFTRRYFNIPAFIAKLKQKNFARRLTKQELNFKNKVGSQFKKKRKQYAKFKSKSKEIKTVVRILDNHIKMRKEDLKKYQNYPHYTESEEIPWKPRLPRLENITYEKNYNALFKKPRNQSINFSINPSLKNYRKLRGIYTYQKKLRAELNDVLEQLKNKQDTLKESQKPLRDFAKALADEYDELFYDMDEDPEFDWKKRERKLPRHLVQRETFVSQFQDFEVSNENLKFWYEKIVLFYQENMTCYSFFNIPINYKKEELDRALRKMQREHLFHPDKYQDETEKAHAEIIMKEIYLIRAQAERLAS